MSTHMISDPTAPDPTVSAGWLTLSAALTDEVPAIAEREDLLVRVAPGAGHGAPACLLVDQAQIEVNAEHMPIDPATARPWRVDDRARYPAAWGALVHECAHACHSRWTLPQGTTPAIAAAAHLLEESRIEAAQIRRRPDDRHWIRACVTTIVMADTRAADPAAGPRMTPAGAGTAAALLLARVDAGILTAAETSPVAAQVQTVLGAGKLAELRELWRAAHRTADEDTDTMLDLARRWCATLGLDPATDPGSVGTGGAGASGSGDPGSHPGSDTGTAPAAGDPTGGPHGSPEPSPLASAIAESVARVASAVAREPIPADPASVAERAREAAARAAAEAADAAELVFGRGGTPRARGWRRAGATRKAGTRPPTPAERSAARQLARALDTAGVRDRVATKTTSAMPPGRLRMRGALAADAQRAAGALPTAEPFTRVTRRAVPAPPLRLGIACDVSGSMDYLAYSVASTAWILAHAARHTRVPATTATVIFGNRVRPITHPGAAPAEVTLFESRDNYEDIAPAVDALDGALHLSRTGAARLLVILSDGEFSHEALRDGQARIDRLRASGCGVLWLTPAGGRPFPAVTAHTLTDPATTAHAIGHAATAALRAAQ